MKTIHKISMDLQNRSGMPRLNMVQWDSNSRRVEIKMTAGSEVWAPEALDTVFLRYRKSDGTGGSYDTLPNGTRAWQLEGSSLLLDIAPQVLTAAGLVEAQAVLLAGDSCLATFLFQIVVEADPSRDAVASEDYINWTAWAQAELDRRLAEAEANGAFSGATFVPFVDSQGNLCWTNDQGAENPDSVNIVDILEEKLAEDVFLKASGGTMSGELDMGGNRIGNLPEPSDPSDAVNKGYVDGCMETGCIRFSVTAAAADWTGDTAPYTQSILLEGMLETDCPHFGLTCSEDLQTARSEKIAFSLVDSLLAQTGSITLTCFDEKPETDMHIQLEVNR